ncbi:MAG: shikimate kinase [Desulfobulbus sp.]|nr:MAG: shikimate kinase [Desulfobulbus sp.]
MTELGPPGSPWERIIFTGFRGTGKSAVGRKIAELTGFIFIDTDDTLEEGFGCSVCDYVKRAGWPAFREAERLLLVRLAEVRQAVIATGGGAIQHQAEWQELRKNSRVIWLRASTVTIRQRMERDCETASQRPSLTGCDPLAEIESVLAAREPLYRAGSDVNIDTDGRSPEEIVARIREFLVRGCG